MPKLLISLPDGSELTHEMTEEVVTVGRMPDNILVVEDGSVSSHHAQLKLEGGDYHLKDLNSTNGTSVNGQTITEHQLQDGDHIRFGKIDARYVSEIPASRRPPPDSGAGNASAAASSQRPADFANASPFQRKSKSSDPIGTTAYALAGLGFIAFAAALYAIFSMRPPA